LPEIPYQKTTVSMDDVIAYIGQSNYSVEVKRSVYVIFRNESGGGRSGVNNNYIGLQADNAKWEDEISEKIVATCTKVENMTGKGRRFACFASFKDSIDVLEFKVVDRGLFIGGKAHPYSNMDVKTPEDFALAYWIEWVTGEKTLPDSQFAKDIASMYNQAVSKFKS